VKTLGGVDGSDAFARWLVGKFTGAPRQNRIGQVRDYRWGGGDESATAEVCKRGEALGSGAHVCLSGARWDDDGVELWRVACGVWRWARWKIWWTNQEAARGLRKRNIGRCVFADPSSNLNII
jgi:hypothetical protein